MKFMNLKDNLVGKLKKTIKELQACIEQNEEVLEEERGKHVHMLKNKEEDWQESFRDDQYYYYR